MTTLATSTAAAAGDTAVELERAKRRCRNLIQVIRGLPASRITHPTCDGVFSADDDPAGRDVPRSGQRRPEQRREVAPPAKDARAHADPPRRSSFPPSPRVFQYCLEKFDLSRLGFVDAEWLAYLGAFRHLQPLNLADCRNVNSQAIWSLTGMTCLRELDLSRCSKINDAGIDHLFSISNLDKVSLSETGVSAEGLMRLSCLQNLHFLDLGGLPVTDRALHAFQGLSQLEHLDIVAYNR